MYPAIRVEPWRATGVSQTCQERTHADSYRKSPARPTEWAAYTGRPPGTCLPRPGPEVRGGSIGASAAERCRKASSVGLAAVQCVLEARLADSSSGQQARRWETRRGKKKKRRPLPLRPRSGSDLPESRPWKGGRVHWPGWLLALHLPQRTCLGSV